MPAAVTPTWPPPERRPPRRAPPPGTGGPAVCAAPPPGERLRCPSCCFRGRAGAGYGRGRRGRGPGCGALPAPQGGGSGRGTPPGAAGRALRERTGVRPGPGISAPFGVGPGLPGASLPARETPVLPPGGVPARTARPVPRVRYRRAAARGASSPQHRRELRRRRLTVRGDLRMTVQSSGGARRGIGSAPPSSRTSGRCLHAFCSSVLQNAAAQPGAAGDGPGRGRAGGHRGRRAGSGAAGCPPAPRRAGTSCVRSVGVGGQTHTRVAAGRPSRLNPRGKGFGYSVAVLRFFGHSVFSHCSGRVVTAAQP